MKKHAFYKKSIYVLYQFTINIKKNVFVLNCIDETFG